MPNHSRHLHCSSTVPVFTERNPDNSGRFQGCVNNLPRFTQHASKPLARDAASAVTAWHRNVIGFVTARIVDTAAKVQRGATDAEDADHAA
jgi:hypothetical protein